MIKTLINKFRFLIFMGINNIDSVVLATLPNSKKLSKDISPLCLIGDRVNSVTSKQVKDKENSIKESGVDCYKVLIWTGDYIVAPKDYSFFSVKDMEKYQDVFMGRMFRYLKFKYKEMTKGNFQEHVDGDSNRFLLSSSLQYQKELNFKNNSSISLPVYAFGNILLLPGRSVYNQLEEKYGGKDKGFGKDHIVSSVALDLAIINDKHLSEKN